MKFKLALTCAALVCGLPSAAWSQVTVKPDGQWRYLFGAGASIASGNSRSTSVNLNGDAVRATDIDKWTFTGRALYSSNEDQTTAERAGAGSQYSRDIDAKWFGYVGGDLLRDVPANLALRLSASSGVGYHLVRADKNFWDVSAGLGYTRDRFIDPADVNGDGLRSTYGRAELVLAEESNTQLTDTASVHQKLTLLPNLRDSGDYRAVFDSNLSVAINNTLSLTAGFTYRYDSQPGNGFKPADLLFVTGISYRID